MGGIVILLDGQNTLFEYRLLDECTMHHRYAIDSAVVRIHTVLQTSQQRLEGSHLDQVVIDCELHDHLVEGVLQVLGEVTLQPHQVIPEGDLTQKVTRGVEGHSQVVIAVLDLLGPLAQQAEYTVLLFARQGQEPAGFAKGVGQ